MKNMNKSTIFVACASDRNYVTPLTVMLNSLLVNLNNERKIVIYILTNDLKYLRGNKALRSLQTKRTHIRFVYVSDKPYKKMKIKKNRITLAAYYRLSIPALLPKEHRKVIYLDSDLIVNEDIGKLWDLDVGQNYILAVQDNGAQYVSSPAGLLMYKELDINPSSKYFNSGVMVINLDKWRRDDISQKVIEFLEQNKERIRWWDQDGLNALLIGKWGELDHRWNVLTQIFINPSGSDGPNKDKEKYEELINHSYIVHFNGASKPWRRKSKHPYKYLYFDYTDMVVPRRRLINTIRQIIFRTMRSLNAKKMRFYYFYYKKIYRKRILFSKPIVCNDGSEFEVHIVTSQKDFLDAIWCLKTFYHYSGLMPRLVIHEDGTLSANGIKMFLKHFVNCKVIRRKDANEDLKHFLANYEYSQKNRLNKYFYCALKLFDAFYYSKTDKLLFLDSDILFFKKPTEIIEYIKGDKPFFNSDYQNAYSKPISELNKTFGVDILPRVNAGLMFLRKKDYINNLNFIENYFEKMENSIQPGDINRHEQTLNALLLSKCRAIRLNENYQISKQSITDKTVGHHFVNYGGSRNKFYKEGLKYLKSIKFLKELNRASHAM